MDQHNVHLYRLNFADIQSLSCIRAGNLELDQDNWANKNRRQFRQLIDIENSDRMEMAHTQQLV